MKSEKNINLLPALAILGAIALLVAVGGYFAFSERTDEIQGQAEVNEFRVSSKVPGRILRLYVSEGDTVHAGDTLVVLEAPDVTAKLVQAEAAEDAARAQSRKAEKAHVRNRYAWPTKCGKKPRRVSTSARNPMTASSGCSTVA